MGSAGVDLEKDCVYTYAVDDAMTKKAIMEASNKSYVMLENRKFSIDGNYRYATVGEFEGFILDGKPEKEIKENIEKYGTQWFYIKKYVKTFHNKIAVCTEEISSSIVQIRN